MEAVHATFPILHIHSLKSPKDRVSGCKPPKVLIWSKDPT